VEKLIVLRNPYFIGLFLLLGLTLILAACSGGIPGLAPTPTNTLEPTETFTPTETPAPTATALPPVGLLILPEGANPDLAESIQAFLADRIPVEGMRFQVRPALGLDDFERDDFRWVIALPPFDDLDSLAAAAPQTRFLAVGFDDLQPTANLAVIARPADWYIQQAFMAGYIGMVITPDWRAGMIRVNTPEGDLAAQAFNSGALFFCSSPSGDLACYSHYSPVYGYPIITYGEPETTADEWPGVGRYMLNLVVETIFVSPQVKSDQLLRYLAQEEVEIIGAGAPLSDISSQWVCSLEYDLLQAFEEYWPEFAAGTEGRLLTIPLRITHVNPDLLSPGRQHFVEIMLENVIAGYVDFGLDTSVNNP